VTLLLRQLFWIGLIGLQFGILAAADLHRGGFSLTGAQVLELTGGHVLLAAVVGAPAVLVVLLIEFAARRVQEAARRPRLRAARRLAPVCAACWTLFVLAGTYVNVEFLPAMRSPISLLGDVALFLAVAGVGLAWVSRPWGAKLDGALLSVVLVLDLAAGVWMVRGPSAASQVGAAFAGAEVGERPNIILLLIDTLRADHLDAYGYERRTAPRLDELIDSGILFTKAYSSTNWTRPAVASLFTSTMPSRHRVNDIGRAVAPSFPLLAETLSRAGYRTVFVSAGPNIQPEDGYGRGVDHFDYGRATPPLLRTVLIGQALLRFLPGIEFWFRPSGLELDAGDPKDFTDRALRWARETEETRPIFLYIHYLGPHDPYDPPAPYYEAYTDVPPVPRLLEPPTQRWSGRNWLSPADRQQMIAQYDGEVLWHDAQLGRLLDGLRGTGRLDDAVVVVIADHGEGFGEHGLWAHSVGMFDEVVRIPMIFWSPGRWVGPRTIHIPVSLIDVAPTLASIAGTEIPESFDGEDLLPWIEGRRSGDRLVFMENPNNDELGIRTAEWAYFEGRTREGFRRWLFRSDDHEGKEELSETHPEVVEQLHQLARARREMDRSRQVESVEIEIGERRREELRALGYLE